MTNPAFVMFGPAHLAALVVMTAAAAGLPLAVRRWPGLGPFVRVTMVSMLVGFTAGYLLALSREGPLSVWDVVPLHLCDFLVPVAAFALITLHPTACEVLYFWGGTGTLLATLTPDLAHGWPDWRFVVYFGLHGTVVAAAALAAFGLGRPPRPGAVRRVFLLTNAYAAVVGLVDAIWGMNFLYLREKPWAPTLLDGMGPWPVYILVVDLLALMLFLLLAAPFHPALRTRLRPRQRVG
jgi:hypothetical integral membrane protein (TIGR02206 family)